MHYKGFDSIIMFIMVVVNVIIIIIIIMKIDLSLCSNFNSDCLELVFSRLHPSSFSFNPRAVGRSPISVLGAQISFSPLMFILCLVQPQSITQDSYITARTATTLCNFKMVCITVFPSTLPSAVPSFTSRTHEIKTLMVQPK